MALPSVLFFSICLAALALIVLLLQRHFLPLRSTPEYLLVSTFLSLLVSSSIVVLLPVDLASSSATEDGSRGVVLPARFLLVAWRIAYWLCFVLTWAILPLVQSFSMSGHRSPRKRIVQALRENARYQLVVVSVGTIGLVYALITSGLHFYTLKGLVIALSYCYSLILAIYLMGHGLVAIPRSLLRDAGISSRLRRLRNLAPQAYDKLLDASQALDEAAVEVAVLRQRKNGSALTFQDWIEDLTEIARIPESALTTDRTATTARITRTSSVPPVITEDYLADLTRRLKLCVHQHARFSAQWDSLVQAAADCQSIIDSSTSKRLTFTKHFSSPTLVDKLSLLNPYTRHLLYIYILPTSRRLLAILLAVASVFIVWSELVHTAAPKLSLVSYTIVDHPSSTTGQIGFWGQIIAGCWLSYMCLCAYYSLTVVKVWGSYALVPRLTSAESACFYASYAARLTVPLAYNFVSFLPETRVTKTVFYEFLGKLINLTPLGERFDNWFPIVILFPVAASLFNLYARIKHIAGLSGASGLGLEDEDEEGGFGSGSWREGKSLIERELSTNRGLNSRAAAGAARLPPAIGGRGAEPRPRRQRYRDDPVADEEESDEEGVFGNFFHRVRNTVETFERPKWMRDVEARVRA